MAGLAAAFGSGAMTNSIADLEESDCFLVTGTNTAENHPVIAAAIKRAVSLRGARLIVIDPRNVELVRYASLWLRQRPGTDVAWINSMLHVIFRDKLADESFIAERTENSDALREAVGRYSPEYAESITGIAAEDIVRAAHMYAEAGAAAILYAMGITQHISGTDAVKSLANLAMATGNIGRRGTGVNPLRGQNNVQGACDMACLPGNLPGYRKVGDEEHRRPFEAAWNTKLPSQQGLTIPAMIEHAAGGTLKALYVMGENPLMSDPDSSHVVDAFKKLDLLIVQDIFLNETAQCAHVVLPSAAWAEKSGTYTNTERRVQRIRKAVDAPGSTRADWEIVTSLAAQMGAGWNYSDPRDIMDEICSVTASYRGITYSRIEHEGLQWPCPDESHPGTPILHAGSFSRGKGLFSPIDYVPADELPDNEYPLLLTTGRILYQYHTATMSRRSRGLVSRTPSAFAELNTDDALPLGIRDGERIKVSSRRGTIEVVAQVSDRCDKGVVFIPFHYHEAAVNLLTNPARDPVANIPEYKVCAIRIEKAS